MNRLLLRIGVASMDTCWIAPWAMALGLWSGTDHPLLRAPSVFGLLLTGSLATRVLGGRRSLSQVGLAGLGLGLAVVIVRVEQGPWEMGLVWLAALGLGLLLWWRGVMAGVQPVSFADIEGTFRWGISGLVLVAIGVAVTARPEQLVPLQNELTPLVIAYFVASLLTLAVARLESFRVLGLNAQWLSVLVAVVGCVVLAALALGELVSFDLLSVATRPLFDLLGTLLTLVLIAVVIPLAYLAELIAYVLRRLLQPGSIEQPPELPSSNDFEEFLNRLLAQTLSPELVAVLKAAGALLLIAGILWLVARSAAGWRLGASDEDIVVEERDSVWEPARLRSALLNWWQSQQRSAPPPAVPITTPAGGAAVANIRELYRQVLRLGASVGATRPTAATPYEHLATLQALLSPADDLAVITQAYVEARYADSEPTPAELDRLVARWQRVQPLTRSDGV